MLADRSLRCAHRNVAGAVQGHLARLMPYHSIPVTQSGVLQSQRKYCGATVLHDPFSLCKAEPQPLTLQSDFRHFEAGVRAFAPSPMRVAYRLQLCPATSECPFPPGRPHLRPRTGMQNRNQIDQTSLPLTHNFTPKLHLGLQPGPMILARSCRFVAHNKDLT